MNILVVDDEKEITDLIQIYLENENFTVYKYYSSQDVLRDIDDLKIDLAILDVMMPDMDGIETLKNLKKIEGFKTPVIALTADAVVGAREKFLKAGFDEYVSKPIIIRQNKSCYSNQNCTKYTKKFLHIITVS